MVVNLIGLVKSIDDARGTYQKRYHSINLYQSGVITGPEKTEF